MKRLIKTLRYPRI